MQDAAITADRAQAQFKGMLLLVTCMSLFSLQDVLIKLLSGDYPVHQILFVRSVVALAPLSVIIMLDGGWHTVKTSRLGFHALRAVLAFLGYTTFYLAIAAVPLADATALFFSAPLFVTAASMPLLGERVGPRRWGAVIVGFLGVIVMLRPGAGVTDPAALLAVACALLYTGLVLTARRLGRTESGASMAFYVMLMYIPASALVGLWLGDGAFLNSGHPSMAFLLRAWQWPPWDDLGLMAVTGLISGFGFYAISQAYRIAEASAIAPFEYIALPWAALWGFLFWNEVPGPAALAGMTLVVGSGIYVLHREAVRGRRTVTGRGLRPRV